MDTKAHSQAPRVTTGEFRRLRRELGISQKCMGELVPESARPIFADYDASRSRVEAAVWLEHAAIQVSQLGDPKPSADMGDYFGVGTRAVCPLCGQGCVDPPGIKGFAFPEGLVRHLLGANNATECSVMKVFRVLLRRRIRKESI